MPGASFVQSSFHGGAWSRAMQGRYDRPDYRTALNVCLNSFPIETGAWTRRPGFRHAGITRSGAAGRLIKFDFQEAAPYNLEFTDGYMRAWSGPDIVTANDSIGVTSISTANPAVMQTAVSRGWVTGNQGYFTGLGATSPLLQGRFFTLTEIDAQHFSLADAVTGATIDGATLGWTAPGDATFNRAIDLTTLYAAGIWSTLRSVQTEKTSFLLNGAVAPYALQVTAMPSPGRFAAFSLDPAVFNDGPYLDPFTNGVRANPTAKVGVVAITLTFQPYDATLAYAKGAFVTSSSVNYKSLVDQNVGHTPASSPTQWLAVNAGEAIAPGGFQGSDVGRLVRLFSEPDLWTVGTVYSTAGVVVSYNPSGEPGAATYFTSLQASTGKQPGLDNVNWTLTPSGAAIWSWGRIVALTNMISGALAGSTNFGDMTNVAAAFDGTPSKTAAASAFKASVITNAATGYVGKNYAGASDQAVSSVTVYPSIDQGFSLASPALHPRVTLNLRGKATLPASRSDGTLLGTSGLIDGGTLAPVSIASSDLATAWKYLWVETIGETLTFAVAAYNLYISQAEFFSPVGTGTSGNGVSVEILGPPLLYTTPIRTWRLGLYSSTTGWPTCGTYHEGRLWLSGAVPNRIDACVSNGIVGGTVNFAPTDQYGQVLASSAMAEVLNAPDANPMFWMEPDLQGIVCGTQAGEWLVRAPTPGSIAANNITSNRVTKAKCANIEPRRTPHTVVFVQAFRRKILEYFPDIYSGKFTAPNLTETAKHLTYGFVDEIAYQDELSPTVWTRVAGQLVGCTYKRDTPSATLKPTIAGWHPHTLGSGRTIESLCVGPSVGGELDALAMVTNEAATGIRHVEIMTDIIEEGAALADSWFLDNAIEPSSTAVVAPYTDAPYGGLQLNGLWHLNGKTVTVVAGGLDCGDWLVTNGSTTVSFGDSVSAGTGSGLFTADFVETGVRIIAGFTYTSDGQIVRPNTAAEGGSRNGPAFAKTKRNHRFGIQVDLTSPSLKIGATFGKMRAIDFRSPGGRAPTVLETASGIFQGEVEDDYSYDGMLCWRQTRPLPATVIAIGPMLHTQDV